MFDDDFFRGGRFSVTPAQSEHRMPSARGFDGPDAVRPLRVQSEPENPGFVASEPVIRIPAYSTQTDGADSDELDIPAFLRRGN